MLPSIWPLHTIVIFDCDSTLSAIEGIDELARLGGAGAEVAALTHRAMDGELPLEAIYTHRLETTNPTREQVRAIASLYRENVTDAAREVIEALQALGTAVFIVSGGLFEPVRDFGVWLGVPRAHIFAVGMEYDQLAGEWWRYWEHGGRNPAAHYLAHEPHPLSGTNGKNRIIRQIRAEFPGRAMLVGDGRSDLEAAGEVDLFVGFGGVTARSPVAAVSPVYVRVPSLAALLPLALGQMGNTPRFAHLWAEGLAHFRDGGVTFGDVKLEEAFWGAVRGSSITGGI
jgi:phosphoserine phosphatase